MLPAWFNTTCPLRFDRIAPADIVAARNLSVKPYLFGADQQPECTNCRRDTLWAHFCRFKSHGPVCPSWDQELLLDYYITGYVLNAPAKCAWSWCTWLFGLRHSRKL